MLTTLKAYTPKLILLAAITLAFITAAAFLDLELPRRMAEIVKISGKNGTVDSDIVKNGFIMLAVVFGAIIANISAQFFSSRVATGFSRNLRKKIFAKVEGFSPKEIDKFGTASLITRTTQDVSQVQQFWTMALTIFISSPITFVLGIFRASEYGIEYVRILAIALAVMVLIILIVMFIVFPLYDRIQKRLDKLTRITREGLTGVRVTRAFNQQKHEQKRFNEANKDLTKTTLRVQRIASIMNPFAMLVMWGMQIAIVYITARTTQNQVNAGGDLEYIATNLSRVFAVFQYSMQVMFAFSMMTMLFVLWPRSNASAKRIAAVLNQDISISEESGENLPLHSFANSTLAFNNVSFTYPKAQKEALTKITFEAKAGQTTAIIGPTGSGKSTLLALIERFYNLDSGNITIDERNITTFNVKDYRKNIGYVPQKAILFKDSIENNLKVGKPDATPDDILEALKIASAEFALEKGLESQVSQGGKSFSGGQKQRLSIARAVIGKPNIYLFDDCFSALDSTTDAKVRSNLKVQTQDAITIIVAQKISTILEADNIIVLEEGKVVSQGKHEYLLESCKTYKEIVASQLD